MVDYYEDEPQDSAGRSPSEVEALKEKARAFRKEQYRKLKGEEKIQRAQAKRDLAQTKAEQAKIALAEKHAGLWQSLQKGSEIHLYSKKEEEI